MRTERAIHTVTGTKVCQQTGMSPFSTRTAPLVLAASQGSIGCRVKLESTSSTGSWGDRLARRLVDELAGTNDTTIVVAAQPWLALPLAAAAAIANVPIELQLEGYAPDTLVGELLIYGAKVRYGSAPRIEAGLLREAAVSAASALVQEIAAPSPDFLVLPEDELLSVDAFRQAFSSGESPQIAVVDWKKRRPSAFAFAREVAATCGLLLGLPGAAALDEARSLAQNGEFSSGQNVLVLDPYAPKFFPEYSHISPPDREENKLGGLITPR